MVESIHSNNMDLFDHALMKRMAHEAPLAARMRPRTLAEFAGQEEIVGDGRLLRRAIESDRLFSSIILWGPPGTGKTTLAMIIANTTQSHFETISAVLAGKAELRRVIAEAQERRKLFGFIPLNVSKVFTVDATSAEVDVIEEDSPWWAFFTTK